MQTVYISIERDRESRSSRDGARFRAHFRAQPGAPILLSSARLAGSVSYAKREVEALFGPLDWREGEPGDVRASAVLEID